MTMQTKVFPSTGGFVAHKIPTGLSHCSAWFDRVGVLQDAELFCVGRGGHTRTVRPGSVRWNELQKVGLKLLPRVERLLREHVKAECKRVEKRLDSLLGGLR